MGVKLVAVLTLVLGGSLLMLPACSASSQAKFRVRMTVQIATPEGMRSGSSVIEVRARYQRDFINGKKRKWNDYGQAVAVDLPGGRTIFALLRTGADEGGIAGLAMQSLDPAFRNDIVESAVRLAKHDGVRSSAIVAESALPMFVTLTDDADPNSLIAFMPEDFERLFGQGVRLERVTVSLTDGPITTGLEKRFPWVKEYRGKKISPAEPLPSRWSSTTLSGASFSRLQD